MNDRVLKGDVYACLGALEDKSIAVAITSPPYWKQRDYGFSGQIGQEETSEEYIGRLVVVYDKLREKLKDNGIFFLNIGDKYLTRYGSSHLLQIPYRLAYHMVKRGWVLEDVIIWYKTNHMPSSVRDRFANTYEPVLVLAKNKANRYKRGGNILRLALQQTQWKHTATFPEQLVRELLSRVELEEGEYVLDPFAGTGTTGVVVKDMRNLLFAKKIYAILIEKGEAFREIIKERVGIKNVVEIQDQAYDWSAVVEEDIPTQEPVELNTNKYGEIFIANDSMQFHSAIAGALQESFQEFHRLDSVYFFGVKRWTLEDLYYVSRLFTEGFVLRNMLIIAEGETWYPIFMFASNNTRFRYRFYLDRVRSNPRTEENRRWGEEDFVGMKVRDISGKETKTGKIVKVLKRYDDQFPKILAVKWQEGVSLEFAVHPNIDEFLMEGLNFNCPVCQAELEEPYDILGKTRCSACGSKLWQSIDTIPMISEPQEILEVLKELENGDFKVGESISLHEIQEKKESSSKFADLDRINWGASPGARKVILGESFTKMRLYRIDQPTVAQYLTFFRKEEELSINQITSIFPESYMHTVGHWFRKDMGGSIPIPEDIEPLKRALTSQNELFGILKRTALKFQTVKASIKGRNPGDFLELKGEEEVRSFLRKLFITPKEYKKYFLA